MAVVEIAKIQVRRGQELQTGMPSLDGGEFGWAEDTQHLYIGAKQVEGAPADGNVRILTTNDLNNLFSTVYNYAGGATASTGTYQYRASDSALHANTTTIAAKLDATVSLIDYFGDPRIGTSVQVGSSGTDITQVLNTAIQDLFNNSAGPDTRRQLKIPAGVYTVNPTVFGHGGNAGIYLPPYTTLIGEGADLTTIILNTVGTNMFQTVDSSGNTFNSINVSTKTKPQYIRLEGMTLSYNTTTAVTQPLLELDLVTHACMRDIKFNTQIFNTLTNTLTVTTSTVGTGVYMKGADWQLPNEQCKNIIFDRCEFNGIGTAIAATGTVVNIKVDNCVFENLQRGIYLGADPADATGSAPSDAFITRNRFKNIVNQAIIVTTSTNRANHVSQNNSFLQVGNGGIGVNDGSVTATATSIISFFGSGCRSISDDFSRRTFAYTNTATLGNFYYTPIILGDSSIENGSVYNSTINSNTTTHIDVFYASSSPQLITIPYTMYETGSDGIQNYNRAGLLTINISPNATNPVGYKSFYAVSNLGLSTSTLLTAYKSQNPNLIYTASNVSSYLLTLDSTPAVGDYFTVVNSLTTTTALTSASSSTNVLYINTANAVLQYAVTFLNSNGANSFLGYISQINSGNVVISNTITLPLGTTISIWDDYPGSSGTENPWVWNGTQFTQLPSTTNLSEPGIDEGDLVAINTTTSPVGTLWPLNFLNIGTVTATNTASWLMSIDKTPLLGDAINVSTTSSTSSVYQLWVNTPWGWEPTPTTSTVATQAGPNNYIIYDAYQGYSFSGSPLVYVYRNFPPNGSLSDYYNYSYTDLWVMKGGTEQYQPTFNLTTVTNNYLILTGTSLDTFDYHLSYQIKNIVQ